MSTAKIMEISCESKVSFEDAIRLGVARAAETVDHIQGAWVKEQKVLVQAGIISGYRVDLKITFLLRDK